MPKEIQELKNEIENLKTIFLMFQNPAQLSPEIVSALQAVLASSSGKTVASGTQAVNEAGSGSYNVMVPPDGFILIAGKNVPYID